MKIAAQRLAGAAALAAGLAMATAGGATTINFGTGGNGNAAGGSAGALTYTTSCSATGIINYGGCAVTQTADGLGVNGMPDTQPTQIDGFPIFSQETLTITFSWAVNLLDFSLGLLDRNDDLEWAINGGPFTHIGPGLNNPIAVGLNYVTSFSVRASGQIFADGLGNDDFTLASANVAPVPVPAAGLLLAGAVGGLAALRRKRKAA